MSERERNFKAYMSLDSMSQLRVDSYVRSQMEAERDRRTREARDAEARSREEERKSKASIRYAPRSKASGGSDEGDLAGPMMFAGPLFAYGAALFFAFLNPFAAIPLVAAGYAGFAVLWAVRDASGLWFFVTVPMTWGGLGIATLLLIQVIVPLADMLSAKVSARHKWSPLLLPVPSIAFAALFSATGELGAVLTLQGIWAWILAATWAVAQVSVIRSFCRR